MNVQNMIPYKVVLLYGYCTGNYFYFGSKCKGKMFHIPDQYIFGYNIYGKQISVSVKRPFVYLTALETSQGYIKWKYA
jgi:hypothetical protein